jgi:TonB dependent receptor/TonB-dependent Receptor Plug Domain
MNTSPSSHTTPFGRLSAGAAAVFASLLPSPTLANHAAPVVGAPQTLIVQGHYNNAIGTTNAASAGTIGHDLLQHRPAQRPGEVLEFVPGVIVTQHSGDGKANQYFLRGFNLDHGTDFATRLGGMPLNLTSHGHGQGYTDMNFLIPELVDRMDYRKGPYFAAVGNFAAAGSADIRYLRRVSAPFGQVTLGGDRYRRAVTGLSTEVAPGVTALGAVEWMGTDGPWDIRQGLNKRNGVYMLTGGTREEGWQIAAMAYSSRWTATDQVPQRLINAGSFLGRSFSRFSSLDPSTGGNTSRASLSGEWHRQNAGGRTSVSAYAVRYDLDLYSNFTYALERPTAGDQFQQTDRRGIVGLDAEHRFEHDVGSWPFSTTVGLQLRHDRVHNGLFDSVARRITATVREDRIRETHGSLWTQSAVEFSPTWRAVAGLRLDRLRANVNALSLPTNSGKASDTLLSPKLAVVWSATPRNELFFNTGRGFHSNDARGLTAKVDPRSGNAVDPVQGMVPITGHEIGWRSEAIRGLQTSVSIWNLRSASELVYIGDAGNTEASAGSRRRGIEISNRWQARPWLLLDADVAFNHARLADGSRVPNAVDRVASLGATVSKWSSLPGWTGSLQLRHLGSGALVEDNSVRSWPSTTMNLRLTRELGAVIGKGASLTLDVFNLGNLKVNDIQYYYESQLPGELAPVADRHVHAAEPRRFRLTFQAQF